MSDIKNFTNKLKSLELSLKDIFSALSKPFIAISILLLPFFNNLHEYNSDTPALPIMLTIMSLLLITLMIFVVLYYMMFSLLIWSFVSLHLDEKLKGKSKLVLAIAYIVWVVLFLILFFAIPCILLRGFIENFDSTYKMLEYPFLKE